MNPACSARLCMNGADARFCLHTQRSRWFQRLPSRWGHKYTNNISKTDLSHITSILPFHYHFTSILPFHLLVQDLSWTNNTAALAKKAQQRLYFLRKLRRARAPAPIMCTFYRGTIESILTSCITVWYGACNASCRKSLRRIVRAAEKIVGVSLPSLQDIYNTRLTRKALSIAGDPTHLTHNFFSLLPSGRRLRSLQARTNRLKDSFITRLSGSWTPSRPCPPSPLLPHESLNSDPPHHHHSHENTHTHTHTHTLTLTLTLRQAPVTCTALDWPHSTTSSDSLNKKDCSLSL